MKLVRVNWRPTLLRSLFATALAGFIPIAHADAEYVATQYAASWGPSIGSTAPELSALDQDGNQQNLKSLKGSNGLLFVFNRSVDW
ncbi:MAG: hypothetical protein GKR90_07215 [Pseudomonadales bacterium]|nr:hypothetical protein [Pseudomonadales bacterium]